MGLKVNIKKMIWTCSECNTDFGNEDDYEFHMNDGCDEAT